MRSGDRPVYLLAGDEDYLKESALGELRSSLAASSPLDYAVFYGDETGAKEITDLARTPPFLSKKRLIVVKNFSGLPKEDAERLAAYIKNPSRHTCLVLETDEPDIPQGFRSAAEHIETLVSGAPSDGQLSSHIRRLLASMGKRIDHDALVLLKELKGNDLLSLASELEKLAAFAGSDKVIGALSVERLVGKSAAVSAFELGWAVGAKDTAKALEIASELSMAGKKEHEIIGILGWHFKRLLRARQLQAKGESRSSVAWRLKIGRRSEADFFRQAAAFDIPRLETKLEALHEADLKIKRAGFAPALMLEFAVMRLCLG